GDLKGAVDRGGGAALDESIADGDGSSRKIERTAGDREVVKTGGGIDRSAGDLEVAAADVQTRGAERAGGDIQRAVIDRLQRVNIEVPVSVRRSKVRPH